MGTVFIVKKPTLTLYIPGDVKKFVETTLTVLASSRLKFQLRA